MEVKFLFFGDLQNYIVDLSKSRINIYLPFPVSLTPSQKYGFEELPKIFSLENTESKPVKIAFHSFIRS